MYVICLAQHLMQSQNLTNDVFVFLYFIIITSVFLSSNVINHLSTKTIPYLSLSPEASLMPKI